MVLVNNNNPGIMYIQVASWDCHSGETQQMITALMMRCTGRWVWISI